MDRVARFVIDRRTPLLWGSVALILLTIAQIPRNELNDDFVKYFDQSVEFRQAADFSDEHLTGMSILEIELSSGESSGINNPTYLQQVEDLTNWLRQQPEMVHVNSLTDIMKRLNRNMHGDDPSYYRLPDNRELAAQYLLLYEMSLPYGLDLNNQINVDKSATRLIATCHNLTSNQIIDLERRTEQWLAENAPGLKSAIASPSLMFAHIGKRNIESMLIGTLTALVLISVLLGFALRSLKFGIISLAPNLIPAGLAFGLWGMWVGEVGLALSVVTGMTLGIIVDDTVHFLSKYLYARRQRNDSAKQAIIYAFHSVGKALWITTVVLSVGFLILSLSTFKVNADMGLLTAITIVIALVVDFILLPILILLFDKESSQTSSDNPAAPATSRQEI